MSETILLSHLSTISLSLSVVKHYDPIPTALITCIHCGCCIDTAFPYFSVELEGEIRLTVDELMREELKNLKMVCSSLLGMQLQLFLSTSICCIIISLCIFQAVEKDKGKGKKGKGKKGKKGKKGVITLLIVVISNSGWHNHINHVAEKG